MAEYFLRSYDPRLEVRSAGLNPVEELHPLVLQVMMEKGIEMRWARPESLTAYLWVAFDFVIHVCPCQNQFSHYFRGAAKRIRLNLEDPGALEGTPEQQLAHFRKVRDQIDKDMKAFYISQLRPLLDRERPLNQGWPWFNHEQVVSAS
ncbi:MAG: hypothetical protein A2508_01950 [Candidatus Lambdaproteobacteria bacterium RIFOXYD12_FULL_49_8]|nr:MAG: hypothetical protein A2508_01950 [Candidatus Lambdaproteobacteria bacterium RIFOXYD12_FULL_49_8]